MEKKLDGLDGLDGLDKLDISSYSEHPSSNLSNFSRFPFVLDEIRINSMEGFLQSLKFKDKKYQAIVCTFTGVNAKNKGKDANWKKNYILYWRGKEYLRNSDSYQNLLNRAYNALSLNKEFKACLMSFKDARFSHSIGRSSKSETILTEYEFCSRLQHLKDKGLIKTNNIF